VKTPEAVSSIIQKTFEKILAENMQGIPILNSRISVQTLGFQEYQDRVMGIIITPWLMNLVLLPSSEEDWSDLALGHKEFHEFPAGKYKFLVNEIDGIGFCQTYSLFSPMNNFVSQEQAIVAAQNFLDKLTVTPEPGTADPVDEELLGRIMRGEETPDLDDFETIKPYEKTIPVKNITDEQLTEKSIAKNQIPEQRRFDRRALLRGNFNGEG